MPKILLVEDSELGRDMLVRRLERRGFDMCVAIDGESSIAAAYHENPDLILMDIFLGEMNGWEATRRLKAQQRTADIPVIAITAHAVPSDKGRSVEAGCVDYDTKPVDMNRLLSKIETALAGAQHGRI